MDKPDLDRLEAEIPRSFDDQAIFLMRAGGVRALLSEIETLRSALSIGSAEPKPFPPGSVPTPPETTYADD